MKRFQVFTILLLLSSFSRSFACGYSPYGEDVRYCLFRPEYFNYVTYNGFNYNADLWGFEYGMSRFGMKKTHFDSNVLDWYYFTGKKVSLDEIDTFLNQLKLTDIKSNSTNKFVRYLFEHEKHGALKYLTIAKQCEDVNSWEVKDSWEREEVKLDKERLKILNKVLTQYRQEKNNYLKRKYAFLAIRLDYYAGGEALTQKLFKETFQYSKKDYLYYWALFFTCFSKSDGEQMVEASRLMANSPEKFEASYYYFHDKFSVQKALEFATTKEDVANIYTFASIQKVDKNLGYLKEIYKNNPKSRVLGFLLLREVNKLEDWVFTPYYTNYEPSILYQDYAWDDATNDWRTTEALRNRSEKDREYAVELLDFINEVSVAQVNNPVIWEASKINLLFMARNYSECLQAIGKFEIEFKNDKAMDLVERIKALCVIANQEYGNAVIKDEVKPLILKYSKDERFLFTLGRELEFKGNLADGMALIATANNHDNYEFFGGEGVEWQGNRNKTSGNLEYFYEYFDYLDFVYSADELQLIINKLNVSFDSEFDKFIYAKLLKDKNYLTDLLGTKYLREDRLTAALKTFETIAGSYWEDNYNAWERGAYDEYYAFNQNPFYDFNHTDSFIAVKEKFALNKLAITKYLIRFLNKANDVKTKDRDYYYFLVANCYFNMNSDGNSWMMRRFRSSSGYYEDVVNESYIDEQEYRSNQKAIYYYQKAYENARTEKFKALCLRMTEFAEFGTLNKFEKLKAEYPQYYKDLSNCNHLGNYFKSRR